MLTQEMLTKLANSFTKKSKVRKLTEQELGMSKSVVDYHFQNNPNDTPKAMQYILEDWNTTQSHPHSAYVKLCRALKIAKLDRLIEEVMGGVPERFEEGKTF